MPHKVCCNSTCGIRIPSTAKNFRYVKEPQLYAQLLRIGLDLPYDGVICNKCKASIGRLYQKLQNTDTSNSQTGYETSTADSMEYEVTEQEVITGDSTGHNQDVDMDSIQTESSPVQNHISSLNRIAIEYDFSDSEAEHMDDSSCMEEEFSSQFDSCDTNEARHSEEYSETYSPVVAAEATYSSSEGSNYLPNDESQSNFAHSSRQRRGSGSNSTDKMFIPDILSVPATESRCFVCPSQTSKRCRITESAILDLWITTRVFVPPSRVRCCPEHLDENGKFVQTAIIRIQDIATKGVYLSKVEFNSWLSKLTDAASNDKSFLNFDSSQLSNEDYKLLTGLSIDNFNQLLSYVQPFLRNSKHRSPRNAVAIFLLLLRRAVSQKMLAFLFKMPVQRISDTITAVTDVLTQHFVPKYLGYHHLTRDQAQKHVPNFVKKLYAIKDDNLAFVLDATYLYIQKSQNFKAQRETYSMHKKRNLVKPMMVILPNGYILESEGLYKANAANNDAGILKHMLKQSGGLGTYAAIEDHFIVDRGFQEAVRDIRKHKIVVHMPELLHGVRQFTCQQANKSRQVTMTRWSVEAVNGRLKHMFPFFDHVIHNSYMFDNKLGKMWRIACALINAFSPALYEDQEKHQRILQQVEIRGKGTNSLKKIVQKNGWDKPRNQQWQKATAENYPEFPKLSMDEIFELTVGVWQTKNAILYTSQHLADDPDYSIFLNTEVPNILRAKIQSRFHNNEFHLLWIEMDSSGIGANKIKSYYCRCKTGERGLGTCSHITSVIWYLGYFRHQDKKITKRSFCSVLLDAAEKQSTSDEH